MDTLKPGNEEAPDPPAGIHFRPPNSLVHRLSDGENWGTLAARYKVDAKALMRQNFKTDNPYEVNWCLREYVKCDKATADRYNWRFSTSSRHGGGPRAGVIFITPNWYAILGAAKLLAERWWRDVIARALVVQVPVAMEMHVDITGADITWDNGPSMSFINSLQLQGATTDLAMAWSDAIRSAMKFFMDSIRDRMPIPQGFIPRRIGDTVPMFFGLPPWALMQRSTDQHGATHFVHAMVSQVDGLDNGPARAALAQFGHWWDAQINRLQAGVSANGLMGHGTYNFPTARFTGIVRADPGFLRLLN